MDEPIRIGDSFYERLPPATIPNAEYRTITASKSTATLDPIPAYFDGHPRFLLDAAHEALRIKPKEPGLLERFMPQLEKSYYLRTEGDIFRVSALELVHPVNVVLSGLLPAGVNVRCGAESVQQRGTARTDLRWQCYRHGRPDLTVAILEYKNTHILRRADWRLGRATPKTAAKTLIQAKGRSSKGYTLLRNNAIVLSKQVIKYSKNCDYIALFDWRNMYIFNFAGVNEDARDPILTEITFSSNPGRFRRLLLGMIYRSLKQEGIL